MNNSHQALEPSLTPELLKARLQQILAAVPLAKDRVRLKSLAADLDTDLLSCAAALLHLIQPPPPAAILLPTEPAETLKMVRYRLDVGHLHQVCIDTLKRVLVEESGVDKNNIHNISVRGLYTLIDLPDAMPADIFLHLKTVEIDGRPLAIKRIKPRYKKRSNLHRRRGKPSAPKMSKATEETGTD
ncbi:DbpA RNA binding domain-containing protein [Methylovulum psychrotolerans]|uniref:ATP-dependent RNA helicase n=1 Tax=Methylovulum psychrotolerans TaxID=1704499 RepID=A0A1Z4BZP6_9GAMM|nr:DbpA RNA binding domain-containing protein [Methylovulum psychrotolerans]ASF46774.1 hypothetical protein CEK71_12190 [Methylovulum psychrotolerans]MBT9099232.1 DbpA RNA binding domain-containing protein [Methylovulum psychrotolerans]POZ50765.1 ATP-dependent RNA helicase [Methylovulum psychrotolerans]